VCVASLTFLEPPLKFYAGVNQCVGLHNERHFVMFMAYLVIACVSLSITGFPHVLQALGAGSTYVVRDHKLHRCWSF
jgi:palmitoyltransferase